MKQFRILSSILFFIVIPSCTMAGILPSDLRVGEPAVVYIDMATSEVYIHEVTPAFDLTVLVGGSTVLSASQDSAEYEIIGTEAPRLFAKATLTPDRPGVYTLFLTSTPNGNIPTLIESVYVDSDIKKIRSYLESSSQVITHDGLVTEGSGWQLIGDYNNQLAFLGASLDPATPEIYIKMIQEGITILDQWPGGNISYVSYEESDATSLLSNPDPVYYHEWRWQIPEIHGLVSARAMIWDGSNVTLKTASLSQMATTVIDVGETVYDAVTQGLAELPSTDDPVTSTAFQNYLAEWYDFNSKLAMGLLPTTFQVYFASEDIRRVTTETPLSSITNRTVPHGAVAGASVYFDSPWGIDYTSQYLYDYSDSTSHRYRRYDVPTGESIFDYEENLETDP